MLILYVQHGQQKLNLCNTYLTPDPTAAIKRKYYEKAAQINIESFWAQHVMYAMNMLKIDQLIKCHTMTNNVFIQLLIVCYD